MKSVVETAFIKVQANDSHEGRDRIPDISSNANHNLISDMTPLVSAAQSDSKNNLDPSELKRNMKTVELPVKDQQQVPQKLGQFRIMTKQIAFDSNLAGKAKFNLSPLFTDSNSRHLSCDFMNESRVPEKPAGREDTLEHCPMVMDQKSENNIAAKTHGPVASVLPGVQEHCHIVPQLLTIDNFAHSEHQISIIDQKVPIANEVYPYNCDDNMYEENICQSKNPSCSIDGDAKSELVSSPDNG